MPLNAPYTDNDRFHCFKPDYQNRSIQSALKRGDLTEEDVAIIQAYISDRGVVSGIGSKRALKITSNLITVRKILQRPFRDVDVISAYAAVNGIHSGTSIKGKPFSVNTRADLVQVFKSLLLWMIDSEIVNISEKKVRLIRIPNKIPTKTPADLISPEQIGALIEAAKSSRYRAILMTLYEGGFRIGEIGELRWKDLTFDGTGVVVSVRFKTDKNRYIRLVMASEYLIKWKSDYPGDPTGDNFVFISRQKTQMTYPAIFVEIGRIAKRAGIDRHLTPHLFRHSRITHLLQQGVHESIVKMMMWGSIESHMFQNYVHLAGSDIDREMFRLYGLEQHVSQVTESRLEPRVCPHCKELNAPVSLWCHLCGHSLTADSFNTADELQAWVLANGNQLIDFLQSRQTQETERSSNL